MTTILALGGHLLAREAPDLYELLGRGPIAVTHGNGPQVGADLLRQELAAAEVEPLPLWVAVAQTQAEIGGPVATALGGACLLTHVLVDPADPAFESPTKPIGPVYDEARARQLRFPVREDPGRGLRRVVASPEPREIVELEAIRVLLEAGLPVVCCGGGGIPVVGRGGRLQGVDAVIDKDRTSALLGIALGARRLLVLTDVPAVFRRFGTSEATEIRALTAAEAEELAPELAAGSMRPKVESAAAFVRATGGEALITDSASLADALLGRAGTRVAV